jgi:streptogramin lyase
MCYSGRLIRWLNLRWPVLLGAATGCAAGTQPTPPFVARFHEFSVPVGTDKRPSWPDDISGDAAGNVWFAMQQADEIGRMSPDGVYTGFPLPRPRTHMDCVVVDTRRGIVWGSELIGNSIVRLDLSTGVLVELPIATPNVSPGDLALGPDGTLWFVEGYNNDKGGLGKVDPVTNAIVEFALPSPRGEIDGIAVDGSGAVWFAELADNKLGRYANGAFAEFDLPRPASLPTNIAFDQAGRLWVTTQGSNALVAFDPTTGTWVEYPIPTATSSPAGLAVDHDGNVWFTETHANQIGFLPVGATRPLEFPIPTRESYPEDIRPIGGRIYFSERFGNKIGWIEVSR